MFLKGLSFMPNIHLDITTNRLFYKVSKTCQVCTLSRDKPKCYDIKLKWIVEKT
jgi:hypothetical protein